MNWRQLHREDFAWAIGIGLILWDMLWYSPGEVSQTALVIYAGLLGFPLVARADRKLNGK